MSNGARIAHVVYAQSDLPTGTSGRLHVYFEFGNALGATSFVVDRDTSEVVERTSYQAYGGPDSDYRPDRWGDFHEVAGYSGKEDDSEVGLTYFGARYYVASIGRWASPDPLTVHAAASDPNPYAYALGSPMRFTDPSGLSTTDPNAPGCDNLNAGCGSGGEGEDGSLLGTEYGYGNLGSAGVDAGLMRSNAGPRATGRGPMVAPVAGPMINGLFDGSWGRASSATGYSMARGMLDTGLDMMRSTGSDFMKSGLLTGGVRVPGPILELVLRPTTGAIDAVSTPNADRHGAYYLGAAAIVVVGALTGAGEEAAVAEAGGGLARQTTTVIGRMEDLAKFGGEASVDTWAKSGRIPGVGDPPVSWAENAKWLMDRVRRGDKFGIATDPATLPPAKGGYIPGVPNGYFTARELSFLRGLGIEPVPMH